MSYTPFGGNIGSKQQITNLFNIKFRAKKGGKVVILASPDNKGELRGNIVLIFLTPYPLKGGLDLHDPLPPGRGT